MAVTVTEDLRDGDMTIMRGESQKTGGTTEIIMIRMDLIQRGEGRGETETMKVVKEEIRDLRNEIKASDIDIAQEKKHNT